MTNDSFSDFTLINAFCALSYSNKKDAGGKRLWAAVVRRTNCVAVSLTESFET